MFSAIIGAPDSPEELLIALFLLKRFASFVVTLVFASLVVFAVLDLLPGNAAQVMLGESATPESVEALTKKLGLDHPAPQRYLSWLTGLATLELGNSQSYDTPIVGLIAERLAVTVPLALLAMALSTVLALGAGVYAASRHNRAGDLGMMAASQLGIAVPSFWFGILLVMLFAVKLPWFPSGGFPGWTESEGGGLWDGLQALVLPAVALAVVQAAILARVRRNLAALDEALRAVEPHADSADELALLAVETEFSLIAMTGAGLQERGCRGTKMLRST